MVCMESELSPADRIAAFADSRDLAGRRPAPNAFGSADNPFAGLGAGPAAPQQQYLPPVQQQRYGPQTQQQDWTNWTPGQATAPTRGRTPPRNNSPRGQRQPPGSDRPGRGSGPRPLREPTGTISTPRRPDSAKTAGVLSDAGAPKLVSRLVLVSLPCR